MFRKFLFFAFVFLAGCSDYFLSSKERELYGDPSSHNTLKPENAGSLVEAAREANMLAEAYFRAGRSSQKAQDVVSGAVILTAASVVAGGVKGASDTALANRGLAAVGLQQTAARGLNKTSIESIYDGAQTLNCVGGVATIYSKNSKYADSKVAAEVTLAVIREVRITVYRGLTRELADYSTFINAFKASLPGEQGVAGTRQRFSVRDSTATPEDLLEYLGKLKGCVTHQKLSSANDPKE